MENKYSEEGLLLHDLKEQEEKAWKYYYQRRSRKLIYFASLFFVGHPERNKLSEDAFGEAILKLQANIQAFDNLGQVEAFLNTAIRNQCIDVLRHFETREKVHKELQDEFRILEEQIFENITQAEVVNAIFQKIETELKGTTKTIFKLIYLEGLSVEEAAKQLDLSITAVNSRRKRGIVKLKAAFTNIKLLILLSILLTAIK